VVYLWSPAGMSRPMIYGDAVIHMAMGLTYTCNRCDFTRKLQYLPRQYLLPGGRELLMVQRHIWCAICNDITVAESFEPDRGITQFYQNRLAELREWVVNPPDLSTIKSKQHRAAIENAAESLASLEKNLAILDETWQEWRALRTAGQKCLRCGNTDISVPEEDTSSIEHFGCGGVIECEFWVASVCAPATYAHSYDPDGVLIEVGKKPTRMDGVGWTYAPMELFVGLDGSVGGSG
jgi:hypothetical protein